MIVSDEESRRTGIVYLDEKLARMPATHVLVVGAGHYQSERLRPLTSPPLSARAVADWFVGPKAAFANPERPLASLAMALSETPSGLSTYADGPVPRATFAEVGRALRAWANRARANPDNLSILFMSGHGESSLKRTGFLFEDYGMDPDLIGAGMTQIEQLISALENGVPGQHLLLFDCCRTPSSIGFDPDSHGTALYNPQADRAAGAPAQWALCSTSLFARAEGRRDKTTLFTECLLEGLNGIAGDPGEPKWPIKPTLLLDRVTKLLALHAREDEAPQTPAGKAGGVFTIALPKKRGTKTFLSLRDPSDWVDSTILLKDGTGQTIRQHVGADGEPAFFSGVFETPVINVEVTRNGELVGEEREVELSGPAMFVTVNAGEPLVVGPGGPGVSAQVAKLSLNIPSKLQLSNTFVMSLSRLAAPSETPLKIQRVLGTNQPIDLEVAPGRYQMEIALPSGTIVARNLSAQAGTAIQVHASPAFESALVGVGKSLEPAEPPRIPARPMHRNGLGRQMVRIAAPTPTFAKLAGLLDRRVKATDLRTHPAFPTIFEKSTSLQHQEFAASVGGLLWSLAQPSPSQGPIWAVISTATGFEVSFLPELGPEMGRETWSTKLIVDNELAKTEFSSRAEVLSPTWSGLLEYLSNRDFDKGPKVVTSLFDELVDAMQAKRQNPLVAMAAALISVGTRRLPFPEQWLHNLSNWFSHIPDGPIILARYRLAQRAPNFGEVRGLLNTAMDRGVPLFSLSMEWLQRGLERVAQSDEELEAVRLVQRIAGRTDPSQTFSVIKLDQRS